MINLVARQLERRMAEALRPLGLAPAYLPVMLSLAQEQPQKQTALAAKLDIRQPTMAQTLGRMERDGLIVRTPDEQDRRATSITLTEKATSLIGQVRELGGAIGQEAMQDIAPERQTQLIEDLQRMSENLAEGE